MSGDAEHWNKAHAREGDPSWFEATPERSLAMLEAGGLAPGARVVDVGGGTARLVDALLDRGCKAGVVDISATAIAAARDRLGARASEVTWIVADVTHWQPEPGAWDFWHDRAAFHFLTDAAGQAAYRAALLRGLAPGGVAVIASFAEDGPDRCSGLPVQRWSPEALAAFLAPDFRAEAAERFVHQTPGGAEQRFQMSRFRRV